MRTSVCILNSSDRLNAVTQSVDLILLFFTVWDFIIIIHLLLLLLRSRMPATTTTTTSSDTALITISFRNDKRRTDGRKTNEQTIYWELGHIEEKKVERHTCCLCVYVYISIYGVAVYTLYARPCTLSHPYIPLMVCLCCSSFCWAHTGAIARTLGGSQP